MYTIHVHTLTGENTGNWGKFVSVRANGYSSFRVKHLLHQALHLKENDKEKMIISLHTYTDSLADTEIQPAKSSRRLHLLSRSYCFLG